MGRLLLANLRMTVRDRQTLFWALVFPLIFVVVFGLFDVGGTNPVDIAIVDLADSPLSRNILERLEEVELLDISGEHDTAEAAKLAVEEGDLEYALILPQELADVDPAAGPGPPVFLTLYFNQANFQTNQLIRGVVGEFANRANLNLAQAPQRISVAPEPVQSIDVTYFDVLLLGLVGMAVMFNSIVVIGVKVSGYRQNRIFHRILATPLPLRNYFAAEVVTHLVLAMIQAGIILAVGVWVFGAKLPGNALPVFVIVALSSIVFLNIGFAIGGRAGSPAAASGLANVVAMPMMFFSGTFFPTANLPAFLPELVKVLPLTPTIDALRAVAIDGEPLWNTWPQLAMILGWIGASAAVAAKMFRFN